MLVPISASRSHEDPGVTDPKERARLYGQWDHVRAYGPDIIDRIRECGFTAERVTAAEFEKDVEEGPRQRFGHEELFFCRVAT